MQAKMLENGCVQPPMQATANYNQLLKGWFSNSDQSKGVFFDAEPPIEKQAPNHLPKLSAAH